MSGSRAALIEIFHSIQGEGRHVGVPMAFVRVARCPIRCRYCDTPHSYVAPTRFEARLGGEIRTVDNPISGRQAAELAVEAAQRSRYGVPSPPARAAGSWVALTGGEPLLYPEFITDLAVALREHRCALHLETAALDPQALAAVLPGVDHLSADYKLPETLASGEHRAEHRASIELAAGGDCTIDVKLVLTADVEEASYRRALADLWPFRDRILLVLQPVTPFGAIECPAGAELVARCAAGAAQQGFSFRVLPQVHKLLGVE